MKYCCNTQGCPKRAILYDVPVLIATHLVEDATAEIECNYCHQTCVTNLEAEPEPELTFDPIELESGYDQGYTLLPLVALDQLIMLYRHYYDLERNDAIDQLRGDAGSVRV